MQKLGIVQEAWDIKRIVIGILLTTTSVAAVGYGVKTQFLDKKQVVEQLPPSPKKSVEGAKVEEKKEEKEKENTLTASGIRETVEDRLESIKEEVMDLKPLDIATSSPQVQKIIKDIQSLEQYPRNQAKEICEDICKSL